MNNNIILDLFNVTEQTALTAYKHMGCESKDALDIETADVMRMHLNNIPFNAAIAYGEGKKDGVPHLENGERLGLWRNMPNTNPLFSLTIDPVDGSGCTVRGNSGATSVLAISEKDSFVTTDCFYMSKLACSLELANKSNINIKNSPEEIIYKIADAKRVDPGKITTCVLDRNRHDNLIKSLRSTGCKLIKIMDCDINPCIQACENEIDLFIGIGGVAEGLLSCAAIKALGGFFQFQFVDNKTFQVTDDNVYDTNTGIKDDVVFLSTGVTDNSLTNGVKTTKKGYLTQTIIMNSYNKKIMKIETEHCEKNI